MAEMAAGILAACLPTFGPLIFRRSSISTRKHDLPTIGSARMRPQPLVKSDSLLFTLDHSNDDNEMADGWHGDHVRDSGSGSSDTRDKLQGIGCNMSTPSQVPEDLAA